MYIYFYMTACLQTTIYLGIKIDHILTSGQLLFIFEAKKVYMKGGFKIASQNLAKILLPTIETDFDK